ncbi:hypothetical protein [Actinomadura keratinilytica]|uniref:hypothetical protein n=1 Tax=Actinomadura keratinilytica TaxID=547461 RepID=UPI00361126FD
MRRHARAPSGPRPLPGVPRPRHRHPVHLPGADRRGGTGFLFVVTDDQITVISTGAIGRAKPRSVWGTYPRGTRIGPVESGAGAVFRFEGAWFEVDDEYVPVINAADAEVFDRDSLPRDPLPDL